jgi:hypothetical protein
MALYTAILLLYDFDARFIFCSFGRRVCVLEMIRCACVLFIPFQERINTKPSEFVPRKNSLSNLRDSNRNVNDSKPARNLP